MTSAQVEIVKDIVKTGLFVRATKQLCNRLKHTNRTAQNKQFQKFIEAMEIKNKLTRALGAKVKLYYNQKRGRIEI